MEPDQQRREALRTANTIRVRRAELKRRLAAGEEAIEPMLTRPPEDDPWWLRTASIYAFARALHGVGAAKLRKAYARARLSQASTFETTSRPARAQLLDSLRDAAPRTFS